ncbi:isochorismatase family protein [Altererythrobacter sp. MF3-039]|uniref:isochorismatase family protein n=1 Tax=Altererythrobacter sp. MF3-039 TaxID=3252901 RepID=UPI00390C4313
MSGTPGWNEAFDGHLPPGENPALLLVDPVVAYTEPGSPLLLETGDETVAKMADLLELFRERGLPIAFTNVAYKPDGSDGGVFFRKIPALKVFLQGSPLGAFPEVLQPRDGEKVITKQYPSAFFSTDLDRWLRDNAVDTLFLVGFSTSGCVRASTLDAMQYGYVPFTVADACGDRDEAIQNANLHDLGAKYAEIITSDQVEALLPN